jgi:hypothetical protein
MMRRPTTRSLAETYDGESGQASVLLILILGTFLLAALGFAVDLSSMWFHRQAAQSAADAACVAGTMDMSYLHNGTLTNSPGFTVGTPGDCSSSATAALCKYAGFNGYTATTAASGWGTGTATGSVAVNWTFPSSVPGTKASTGITYPFLTVMVREMAPTWFMGLVGVKSMTVGASCTCGLLSSAGGPPIVVLNPTIASALSFTGGVHVVIAGGPTVSIQVNSSSASAVACSGGNGYSIDTSAAGPSGTGGQLAIVGGPAANPFCGAYTTLKDPANTLWHSSAGAVPDPYGSVAVPMLPPAPQALTSSPLGDASCNQTGYTSANCGRKDTGTNGFPHGIWVGSGTDSCPHSGGQLHYIGQDSGPPYLQYSGNCLEYTPGYYPAGINVTADAGYSQDVAIFMPGVYYLNGNLSVSGATTIRNAWIGTQPSTQGVVFYFLTGGPTFSGGSGQSQGTTINSVPSYYLNCSGTATPAGMPTSITGNLLASQCSSGGTYVGAPSSDSYSATGTRGLLFFLDHSDTYSATLMDAGSSLNFTGALYFHNSNYADSVTLSGAGSSSSYDIGNIVVDRLILNAAGTINMGLTGSSLAGPPVVGILQ